MELRQYWQIIWRRIWILPFLISLVAMVSWFTYQTPQIMYQGSLRFAILVEMQTVPDQYNFDGYYTWISSEYLTDLLSIIVASQVFADDVNAQLAALGSQIRISANMISAESKHRTLLLNFNWPNPDELSQIGQAIVLVMEQGQFPYFTETNLPNFLITTINAPIVPRPISPPLTDSLDLPIRLTLAILAGLGLIFLLDYLDTSIRSDRELETMGLTILAKIPSDKKGHNK